jgi:hypothetical protein
VRLLAVLMVSAFILPLPALAEAPAVPPAQTQPADRLKSWSNGQDQVDALLRAREASDYTDDWKALHEDGGWFGATTAQRADAVIGILATSKLRGIRGQLHDLQADIQSHREKIRDTHFAAIGQVDSDGKEPGSKLIDAEEQAIQADQSKVSGLNNAFSAELHQAGVNLSPTQLNTLLNVNSGDDLSEIMELFASLRTISDALEESTIRSSEDVDTAKKYYEIYAVLMDTALYSETSFIHKLDELWIPRIDAVTLETHKLRLETDKLLATASDGNRPVLLGNQKAQSLTLQTADVYRRILLAQRHAAADTVRKLLEQRNVALNTYKTVAQSTDLIQLIRTSGDQSQHLLQVEIPPLRPFESEQMKLEFDKLSGQINRPAS